MKTHRTSHDAFSAPRRALVVLALFLYVVAWLIVDLATRDFWLNNLLRSHLPDWALWVIALSTPITAGLAALRSVPWKVTIPLVLTIPVQGAVFGLVGEKHPYLQGAVTIFLYFEAYLILPEWNRRIEQENDDGTVLHLK